MLIQGKYWKGKNRSNKTKKKISQALKGRKLSEETKKKMSETRKRLGTKPPSSKGRKLSEETKKKMSETRKGRKKKPMSKKAKKHLSLFWKGKKKSKEHIENIRKAKVGRNNPNFGISFKMKKETKRKISETRLGEKNWNWKGGVETENKKIRKSLEYKFWRRECFKRDNFTCQKYDTFGGELNVHHINNFSDFPELRFIIDNGITLSEKAHQEFHKKYGKKNNTKKQLLEFLNN